MHFFRFNDGTVMNLNEIISIHLTDSKAQEYAIRRTDGTDWYIHEDEYHKIIESLEEACAF